MIKEYIIKKSGNLYGLSSIDCSDKTAPKLEKSSGETFKTFDWDVIPNELLTNGPILMPVLRVHENQ